MDRHRFLQSIPLEVVKKIVTLSILSKVRLYMVNPRAATKKLCKERWSRRIVIFLVCQTYNV